MCVCTITQIVPPSTNSLILGNILIKKQYFHSHFHSYKLFSWLLAQHCIFRFLSCTSLFDTYIPLSDPCCTQPANGFSLSDGKKVCFRCKFSLTVHFTATRLYSDQADLLKRHEQTATHVIHIPCANITVSVFCTQ